VGWAGCDRDNTAPNASSTAAEVSLTGAGSTFG
jgi:hypothetical protein